MTWTEIRQHYPHQWLLVEALLAHSKAGKRQLDELAVIDAFTDGEAALRSYLKLHRDAPLRELYVVHSDREELEITERPTLELRPAREARRDPLIDNPNLAEAVRVGWITPAEIVSDEPPPRLPVAPLRELLLELDEDQADR